MVVSFSENIAMFFSMCASVECMQLAGVCGHFTIHRYRPCRRALNLPFDLNRPRMTYSTVYFGGIANAAEQGVWQFSFSFLL